MYAAIVRLAASVTAVAAALLIAACASGDAGVKTAPPGDGSAVVLADATRPVPAGAATVKISVSDFNATFSAMKKLKPVTKAGHGLVAVLLPDMTGTLGSDPYVRFDAPYLKRAFSTAGLPGSQLIVQNALNSVSTQLSDAQSDIAKGARVLILDPIDSYVGQLIESYAKRHGVPVIDYDQFTAGGSRRYFVSFDQVAVGKAMGHGLVSCVSAWGVKRPKVIVMTGGQNNSNAALLARGYDEVMAPYFKSGAWVLVSEPPGTWDQDYALSEFLEQYEEHPGTNAALTPSDFISAAIISDLKHRIKAKALPLTGQFAILPALRNILAGYQCGTAYEPDYLEAQGAAALALFLRAGLTPPASLLNGHFEEQSKVSVPSMLFKPVWVTTKNMKSTVIADKYVTVAQLCAGPYAAACKAARITG